ESRGASAREAMPPAPGSRCGYRARLPGAATLLHRRQYIAEAVSALFPVSQSQKERGQGATRANTVAPGRFACMCDAVQEIAQVNARSDRKKRRGAEPRPPRRLRLGFGEILHRLLRVAHLFLDFSLDLP